MTDADDELHRRVRAGDHVAVARALTRIERSGNSAEGLIARFLADPGQARVIGITGAAGSGKSTLVAALTAVYRRRGASVGILAVDPSSSSSGGAILGDRIRMSSLAGDSGVFIRSFATRGAQGGLSRAVFGGIAILDAAGLDVIIIETVGGGQADVDVAALAQSVAVLSVPGMGDALQAMKAGMLEIADIHVVNKADRPGADVAIAQIREVLRLAKRKPRQWNVPIQPTVATTGAGIEELADLLAAHQAWLAEYGDSDARVRRNAATRIRWAAEELMMARLRPGVPEFEHAVGQVASHDTDPATAARRLLKGG
ncbi:methylmalonyl Co-A mutase-associated GTPase MeaB [Mycobacterium sp. SM1]|uniref:methylmalonyl Co-A mutase-associated GTPase MeaB n=1 Tax=Mycobacterium sp. SM1 TaxID=2816243 RepID=UPI001BCB16B6|nr:methylmalonyl Co-A mutase-associated GTPase MeaB [Mycobacterium sp. SM1]MBS4730403.1 methylmalonyl Co-A mutase-associated GTPase MeaB [Mycobacterium sp. SM1]